MTKLRDISGRVTAIKPGRAGLSPEPERATVHEGPPDRLDRVLSQTHTDLSRNRLQDLIRTGFVTVDGVRTGDPSAKVAPGACLTLEVPPAAAAEPEGEAIPLVVVHEDDDLIVIDKPAGLVVHPAAGHESGTLVNALIAHCGDSLSGIGGVKRPGIVHRLDKDTSGLLVVAKNDRAHRHLAAQFADHGRTGPLEREYLALVWGAPDPARGVVAAAIARSRRNREKMAVAPPDQGRFALTRYEVEETFAVTDGKPLASTVRCALETGRTHQIRVHMAHLGHPVVGDALYGSGFQTKAQRLPERALMALVVLGRQALHAALLGFEHPRTGNHLRYVSAPPSDIANLIAHMRG